MPEERRSIADKRISPEHIGHRQPAYIMIPLRAGQSEDVAKAAPILAFDKASYATIFFLALDGGRLNSLGSGGWR